VERDPFAPFGGIEIESYLRCVRRRHSILLIVHRDPDHVRRLVRRLRHPLVDVWLHVDAKAGDPAPYTGEGGILLPRRHSIAWAGFGCVQATLDWLRAANARGDCGRFTILSGQDYPLRDIGEIVERLGDGDRERIETVFDPADRRYRYQALWANPSELPPLRRTWVRVVRKLWYRGRLIRVLPRDLVFAWGSAYWTLGADAVAWILAFLRERPDVERFFQHTFAPDEMFFHTLLASSPFRDRLSPGVHHIDWSGGGAHPKLLGMEDLPALRSSDALFARKFPAGDPVLDELDRFAGGASRTRPEVEAVRGG